jgi:hypothetical protein
MHTEAQILNKIIPFIIGVLAILPFLFMPTLRKKDEEIAPLIYRSMLCYLICLGLVILGLIIIQSTTILEPHHSSRSLFICAILLVACMDKAINLAPQMIFIKASLIKRLLYFVFVLCSIPIARQILTSIVPRTMSENLKLMWAAEVFLVLIMLALGIFDRPGKKKSLEQNS